MRIERAYRIGLRLYPADYRIRFAAEMLAVFEQTLNDYGGRGGVAPTRFVFAELTSLVLGIGAEWIAKLTADPSIRGRCLPDCRKMRPPGVTPQEWSAGL